MGSTELPETQTVLETGTCYMVVLMMVTEQDHRISAKDHRPVENVLPTIQYRINN